MKTILPWVLAVAFAAAAGAMYFSKSSADAELAKARDEAQQTDTLRGQLDDAQKQVAALNDQVTSLNKDNQELLRLRNQVRQLGDEKAQLQKQLQVAQSTAERSQDEVQRVQAATKENARAMAEQQILQIRQTQAVISTCINNLRQIQAAKQQWALENNRTADAIPTPPEIAAYLPNHQMPECPGGGRYTLNAVNVAPTCSIPGHVLQ
ncbi:MAG TPA: hypothetical protein VN761_10125 [Candidatus Polarisedimenticolia bacterium]|nr:hypothetical protein [Candidatus Polarisedimenticolia bacterium]